MVQLISMKFGMLMRIDLTGPKHH